ncbi:hypothetical protein E2C01_076183 [Portunus trituberculatus]|uniref:Uncharacterized protein n=1 Tax=Portunus trituberculatus TaxID=210409 RepID=A0A5B7II92_PORTR|nr:hypothetical protein [Portunus trituberculatus]
MDNEIYKHSKHKITHSTITHSASSLPLRLATPIPTPTDPHARKIGPWNQRGHRPCRPSTLEAQETGD